VAAWRGVTAAALAASAAGSENSGISGGSGISENNKASSGSITAAMHRREKTATHRGA